MAQRYTSREMIDKLVSFDTVSRHSNLALIAFVEDYLAQWGVPSQRIVNAEGTKANLFASAGPADQAGGIVLSGHTDVVPVDGQDWASDPFSTREADGLLHGRGTCDMKSFIAIALAHLPDMIEAGLERPVHFALSYDEEVGCLGVRPMIDQALSKLPRPEIVIVGEPTMMKVVNAHKAIHAFRTEVTGFEAHSSRTHAGVNAISYAARIINFLEDEGARMRAKGDATERFDPPYTTVHIGTIEGGTALNIIPRKCSFVWEFRALPDQDVNEIPDRVNAYIAETLLPKMREISSQADVTTEKREFVPGLMANDGSPGETLVLKLAERNEAQAVSYGTEAGLFQIADLPTVICGPGSIDQAHQPNEFIALEQIAACDRFFSRLTKYVCGQTL